MKHLKTLETFKNFLNEAKRSKEGKPFIGKTIKDVLTDWDGVNEYVVLVMTDGSKMTITAFPAGEDNVGLEIS